MSEKGQKISDFTTRLTDLEKSVVCNMATSIRTSRSVLHIYGKINSSQTRCVNRLKEKKIIKELPSGFIYTFTKQGIDLLERDYHDWYEFYMRYTSNNRPGGTETHKAALLFAVFGLLSIGSTAKTATRKRILSTSSAGGSKRNLSTDISTGGR